MISKTACTKRAMHLFLKVRLQCCRSTPRGTLNCPCLRSQTFVENAKHAGISQLCNYCADAQLERPSRDMKSGLTLPLIYM